MKPNSEVNPKAQTRAFALALTLPLYLAFGCHGGVDHPPPGQPNSAEYCSNRSDLEDNCMACSSQPGCGWCDVPAEGQASCQPGTDQSRPSTCQEGWAQSTEACAPPPPPPPPAAMEP